MDEKNEKFGKNIEKHLGRIKKDTPDCKTKKKRMTLQLGKFPP